MNPIVPVRLSFDDGQQRRDLDLRVDLTASPANNDPEKISARIAQLHGLSASQQEGIRGAICDQLHEYALFLLSCQGKSVGTATIQQSGLHLPTPSQLGHLATASAAAHTGAPAGSVPAQPLIGSLLALAGVHAAPPGASATLAGSAAVSRATTALGSGAGGWGAAPPAGTGPGDSVLHVKRTYMTKRRRLEALAQAGGGGAAAAAAAAAGGRGGGPSTPSKGSAAAATRDSGGSVDDDGNVDYCELCDDAGDLVCCDRCPRSFHLKCLRVRSVPDGEWRCPVCVRSFGAHGEHETEAGAFTGPVVTRLFPGPFLAPHGKRAGVQAELWDILEALRDHEFAPSFLAPVDVDAVPGYAAAVKHPRDLGTIREGMSTGAYGVGSAFDAARVVADLRLVFHNCRWFNKPLSTIWRMADVLFRELETALRDRVALTPAQAARLEQLREAELPPLPPLPPFGGAAAKA